MKFYRADIDGLRGIAILIVLLYHLGISKFYNGFIGVDIFFVLSGYLITNSIINNITKDKFTIISFYFKRFKRLYPALLVVLLSSLILGLILLPPPVLLNFNYSIFASLLFLSNFLFFSQVGYFDTIAQLKPLLHTWSLGIEEQFYLIVPLLVALSRSLKSFLISIIIIFFISFFLFINSDDQNRNFFLPQYRAWQICIGAICAFILYYKYNIIKKISKKFSYLGMMLIIFSYIFADKLEWPNNMSFLLVIGSSLIILNSNANKLLENKFLTFLGKRSYSIYLVHYPVISFAGYFIGLELNYYQTILTTFIVIILSLILYEKVEKYFIESDQSFKNSSTNLISFLSIILICIFSLSYFIKKSDGFLFRDDKAALEKTVSSIKREHILCKEGPDSCIKKYPDAKVVIIGDSNAYHFAVGAAKNSPNNSIIPLTFGGCVPFAKFTRVERGVDWNKNCINFNNKVKISLDKNFTKEKIALVSAAYIQYLYGDRLYENYKRSKLSNFPTIILGDLNLKPLKDSEKIKAMRETLFSLTFELSSKFKEVIILGPIPPQPYAVNSEPLLQFNGHDGISTELFYKYSEKLLEIFFEIEKLSLTNVKVIYPHKQLCDSLVLNKCVGFYNKQHYYGDEFHISAVGQYVAYSELFKYLRTLK